MPPTVTGAEQLSDPMLADNFDLNELMPRYGRHVDTRPNAMGGGFNPLGVQDSPVSAPHGGDPCRGSNRSGLRSAGFNQTTFEALETPHVVRMRRRDGSVEWVDVHLLDCYLRREARAMRHELLARWGRVVLRRLREAPDALLDVAVRVAAQAHRIAAALRGRFATSRLDARERYLSAATDHADLEQRSTTWDRHERSRITRPQCLLTWRGDRS
jgi:hypothetical protein